MAADRNGLPIKTLATLRRAEAECTRCPLYRFATQVVPGEGPPRVALILVGQQPSFLLRIKDAADNEREYESFVSDLRKASKIPATLGLG